jgi:hypothetical protein
VAAALSELLLEAKAGDEVPSIAWIRRLSRRSSCARRSFGWSWHMPDGALPAPAEQLVAEFHERAVKALDDCNAAHDGID